MAVIGQREFEARGALLAAVDLIDDGEPEAALAKAKEAASWLEGCRRDERVAAAVRELREAGGSS